MIADQSSVVAVVLCGGSGTRLWPLSRKLHPKQFLPLLQEHDEHERTTLFAHTIERINSLGIKRVIIVCYEAYRFFVAHHLIDQHDIDYTIVTEPLQKNTAPATTIGALAAMDKYGDVALLVMPSDHLIGDVAAFGAAIKKAHSAARDGCLMVFGVKPTAAETGFGYIIAADAYSPDHNDALRVTDFKEKPDQHAVHQLLANKNCYWNSGIFMFHAAAYMQVLDELHPEIKASCERAYKNHNKDFGFIKIALPEFHQSPAISIDYAVMEHARNLAVVLTDMQWRDLGSWDSLARILNQDEFSNRVAGDLLPMSSKNNIVFSGDKLVSLLGIEDCIVVNSEDAILFAKKNQAGKLKSLVNTLIEHKRNEAIEHRKIYRPWGSHETLVDAGNFKVKVLIINPGQSLSLQSHQHRSEHWVVVKGEAVVSCNGQISTLQANQSTYIPALAKHRIENKTDTPTYIVEVQCGTYLGEDDITRYEDEYGRA